MKFLEHLKRPRNFFILIAMALLLLFPKLGPSDVKFRHLLPACASQITVTAFDGTERVRSFSHLIAGQRQLEHTFLLPKGEYLLRVELECGGGRTAEVERTLMLDKAGTVELDLERECSC
jgi:hypothetical protein